MTTTKPITFNLRIRIIRPKITDSGDPPPKMVFTKSFKGFQTKNPQQVKVAFGISHVISHSQP